MRVWKTVKAVLSFELPWKLCMLSLVNPLFRGIYQSWVSAAGLGFNAGALRAFLSLRGIALFLLLFLGTSALICYEYCVIIRIAALCRREEPFTLAQVMQAAVWDLGVLRGWSALAGAVYFVLLLPLVSVGYTATLAPRVTIPWFVMGEMQKTALGTVGTLAIYAFCTIVPLLLLFTPVHMVLHHRRFGPAAGASLGC